MTGVLPATSPGQAPERELTALRRRRGVARCLACAAGASAFFGLYALSWMLVLDL